jgi:hypothetical protein
MYTFCWLIVMISFAVSLTAFALALGSLLKKEKIYTVIETIIWMAFSALLIYCLHYIGVL